MKTELRIEVFVGIQANAITASNVLDSAGDGVPFPRLHISAKSKITAQSKTCKKVGPRIQLLSNDLRLCGRRLPPHSSHAARRRPISNRTDTPRRRRRGDATANLMLG